MEGSSEGLQITVESDKTEAITDKPKHGTTSERPRDCRSAAPSFVVLLHPPLGSAGVSIGMEREGKQNDSLANG